MLLYEGTTLSGLLCSLARFTTHIVQLLGGCRRPQQSAKQQLWHLSTQNRVLFSPNAAFIKTSLCLTQNVQAPVVPDPGPSLASQSHEP
jgi:hypothetical protein